MPLISPELLKSISNNNYEDEERITDTQLDLSNQILNEKQLNDLAAAFAYNRQIEEVDLSNCGISNEAIISFARTYASTLEEVKRITPAGSEPEGSLWSKFFKFNLAYNGIEATGIKELWQAFSFQELDISANPIGDEGALLLANASIYILRVEECRITNIGASALFASTTLVELDLSLNYGIVAEAFKILADNKSTALKKLTVKQAGLNAACAKYIAQATGLQEVCLTTNSIGDEGAECLARCSHLQVLYLGANNIGIKGAAAFGRTVEEVNRVFPFVNLALKKVAEKAPPPKTATVLAQTSSEKRKKAASLDKETIACRDEKTYLPHYQEGKKKETAALGGAKKRASHKKAKSKCNS